MAAARLVDERRKADPASQDVFLKPPQRAPKERARSFGLKPIDILLLRRNSPEGDVARTTVAKLITSRTTLGVVRGSIRCHVTSLSAHAPPNLSFPLARFARPSLVAFTALARRASPCGDRRLARPAARSARATRSCADPPVLGRGPRRKCCVGNQRGKRLPFGKRRGNGA